MITLSILAGVCLLLIGLLIFGAQRLSREWDREAEVLRGDE